VLGPVIALRGATEISFGSAKHQRLLAVLLLRVNERVSRSEIIDFVWDVAPPKSAVNLVQKYVGDLRRAFGSAGGVLRSLTGGYRLRLAPEQLDSTVFGELVAGARTRFTAGDLGGTEHRLRDALALWRGPAYDGVDVQLVGTERVRLDELRVTAVEDLAEIALIRGDHDTAAADLARLTTAHPLRERPRELQMLALYRQGRRAEALGVFTGLRALLADELGIDPGPRLLRRYEQILSADPALERPDDGECQEERVDLVDLVTPVRQLPLDVSDFTGRADLLDTVTELVATDPATYPTDPADLVSVDVRGGPPRVVVVVGGPGVGKSSVVVHAAHAVSARYPDGQLYLDLAGTSEEPREPAEMLAEVLRVLAVAGSAIPDSLHERAALYRSLLAGRRMLVVLDDAAHAEQVRPLLPATGGCVVLVTSRNLLTDLTGARHVDLDVLRPGEARQLFTRIVGEERVAREPAEATAILASCDNLPLAIRIAGAKLAGRPAWSLRVLRERLDDESRRLTELRVGELGVRASFELSLRLLPIEAAHTLCLLGLLGSHTLPDWVVGPLLDRPDADDVLDVLVDASLLRLTSTDDIGQPRYRLHDLIRTYAVEVAVRIPREARAAAIGRVLAAWLELANRATERLPVSLFHSGAGRAEHGTLPSVLVDRLVDNPFGWFDAERETLLGAVKLAVDWELDELAWRLATSAVPYYDHRCLHQHWQRGHQVALRAVRATGNLLGEAALLRGLGQVHVYRDDLDDAVRDFDASRRLSLVTGDQRDLALSIAQLSTVNRILQRHDVALDEAHQALEIVLAEGDRHLEAQLRASIGVMRMALGQHTEAAARFEQALTLARSLGDTHRVAVVLRRLSQLHDRLGRPDDALDCLRQALDTFEELDDERCAAYSLLEIGRVHSGRCDRERAAPALERAAGVFRRHGDRRDEAECWHLLGELDLDDGDSAAAHRHLGHALRLWRTVGDAEQTRAVTVLGLRGSR
jgi:DNA-binding SARP family transcriptional activator/tetratricopeptide (TPR) repeat protein